MIKKTLFSRINGGSTAKSLDRFAERQLASNDCGLAICKAALNICGISVARHQLRESLSFDEEGSSFEDVKSTLITHGVDCAYRILEPSTLSLRSLATVLPCIVMVESGKRNHYLLLHSATATGVNVLDPQKGYFEEKSVEYLRDNLSRVTSVTNEDVTLAYARSYVAGKCQELGISYEEQKPKADLIMDYNKVIYLESLEKRLQFKSQAEKSEYLSELFASEDDSVVPSRFKTFRIDAERLLAKTPLALSFTPGDKKIDASQDERGEPVLRLLAEMMAVDTQRSNLKKLLYIGMLASALSLLIVYANQVLIDEVIPTREISTLYAFVSMLFLVRGFELLLNLMKSYTEVALGKEMDGWLCRNLHERLVYSTFESITSYSRGELSLRLNDLLRIKSIVAIYINDYLFNFVLLLMAALMTAYINFQVSLVVVAVSVCYALILKKTVKYVKSLESRRFTEKSQVVNSLINIVEGHGVIAKNGCEPAFLDDQRVRVDRFLDVQFKAMLASQLLVYIPRFIAILGSLSVVLLSAKLHIVDREVSLGQIFTLIALSEVCFVALRTILRTKLNLQEQAVVVDRYFDLISIEQRRPVPTDDTRIVRMGIRDLVYQYPASTFRIAVPELTLHAGDRILLSGANGSGKSTLLKIISGLVRKNVSGAIEFHGADDVPISADQGFARVALIRAEDKIFSDTIGFNITLSNERGGKKIYEYARRVGAEDFISPTKYPLDSLVHDQGANLSTGQRRKLLILRLLFSRADIIIFDEIFRGIDNDSKKKIVATLNSLSPGKVIIYTTHEDIDDLAINRRLAITDGQLSETDMPTPAPPESVYA
jgi:subfamily B ATP-binding cassette protein HlyB/CyaB